MSDLLKSTLLHPFMFAFFPIIFIFSVNVDILEFNEIIFPLLIIGVVTLILIILLRVILNKEKTSLIVSLGMILFFSYGHLFNNLNSIFFVKEFYLLLILTSLFILGVFYFVKTKRKLDNITTIINVISMVLILISSITIISFYLENSLEQNEYKINDEFSIMNEDFEYKPNVYYIILDAYAGSESLNELFHYDNSEFISFLEKNGFQVMKKSHSNYPSTEQSLSSSLNMNYVHQIIPNMKGKFNIGAVGDKIDNNKVMKNFKTLGYKIINFNSGIGFTRDLQIADETLCKKYGEDFLNFEMINLLTKTSMIFPIQTKLYQNDMRNQILCIFNELPEIHKQKDEPFFVFAHIFVPHRPFIFGANGEMTSPNNLEIAAINEDKTGYINQLIFTNKKVVEVIDEILSTSENQPIIIIQGDHGATVLQGIENLDEDAIKERYSNLNAYHLPGKLKIKPYEGITPVNSFRLVFNNYFNTEYQLLDDKSFLITTDTSESIDVGKYLTNLKN